MFTGLRAVHVAVKNLEEGLKLYNDNFGMKPYRNETMPALGTKNAMFKVGDAIIELIEPLDHTQGPLAKFLQNRGEGVYMIALEVENMDKTIKTLTAKGVRLLNTDAESRKKGIPVFMHPQATKGVLVELVQKA